MVHVTDNDAQDDACARVRSQLAIPATIMGGETHVLDTRDIVLVLEECERLRKTCEVLRTLKERYADQLKAIKSIIAT